MKMIVFIVGKIRSSISGLIERLLPNCLPHKFQKIRDRLIDFHILGETQEQSRNTLIVMDFCRSMGCIDYYPTRVECGIKAGIEYINCRFRKNKHDLAGIFCFNNTAYYGLEVDELFGAITECHSVDTGCKRVNAVGEIQRMVRRLEFEKPDSSKRIVLLTDPSINSELVNAIKEIRNTYHAAVDIIVFGKPCTKLDETSLRQLINDIDGSTSCQMFKDSAGMTEHFRNLA